MAEAERNVVIWGDGSGSTFEAVIRALHNREVSFNVTGVITTSEDAGILEHVRSANEFYGMDIEPLVVEGQPGRRQDDATQERILGFLARRETQTLSLMGAMVIMGATLVDELNGEVPEENYPKTLDEAFKIMHYDEERGGMMLPDSFPNIVTNPGRFGLINTHPAPTIVTANTHGPGASRRLIELGAAEGGQTLHVVAKGIDTGPTLAFNRFPTIPLDLVLADDDDIEMATERLFARTQKIEKAHIPYDLEAHLDARARYLSEHTAA